jgi:uncharacterized membrane protein SpoIIM required for sporulation
MDRNRFVPDRRARWESMEALLAPGRVHDAGSWSELAAGYRALCADLSVARGERLPREIQAYLDNLTARAHNQLYGSRPRVGQELLSTLLVDVPREVRANASYFWASFALFYGPMVLCGLAALQSETFAHELLGPGTVEQMEAMYDRAPGEDGPRANAAMAGFYVWNNVGIALRCFATGAMAGVGTVVTLVYNGAVIGTVFGALTRSGRGENLWAFVSGHGGWELTGIVVAGAAGLRLGGAMIETGGLTRFGSVRAAAPSLYLLVLGAGFMLLVAAAIEGFWSAGPVPAPAKLAFGLVQLGVVAAWLALGGRGSAR